MKRIIFLSGVAVVLTASAAFAGDRQSHSAAKWDMLDTNGDGEVTLSEMNAHHQKMFADADTDGNGAISKEEMHAHYKKMHEEHLAQLMGDKNGDGAVSRDEFDATARAHFEKLDANHDGVLSDDELAAGRGHGKHRKHKR